MDHKNSDMPNHKKAKLDVLKALRQVAMELIKERSEEGDEGPNDLEHLQRVSVMAKDKQGLEKGLDKAKDVLEGLPEHSEEDEADLHLDPSRREEAIAEEALESPEEQADEETMLLKKLEELRSKKKMLKA